MNVYVAYNHYGDLIAEADSYDRLVVGLKAMGIDLDEVTIGKVSP